MNCEYLRKSAKVCENLRRSAKVCENLRGAKRLTNSAKEDCERRLRKSAVEVVDQNMQTKVVVADNLMGIGNIYMQIDIFQQAVTKAITKD